MLAFVILCIVLDGLEQVCVEAGELAVRAFEKAVLSARRIAGRRA